MRGLQPQRQRSSGLDIQRYARKLSASRLGFAYQTKEETLYFALVIPDAYFEHCRPNQAKQGHVSLGQVMEASRLKSWPRVKGDHVGHLGDDDERVAYSLRVSSPRTGMAIKMKNALPSSQFSHFFSG
jgi:hypothetical protein